MNFGTKLQNLRKSKGFTQEQLADQLGVSRQAVSKWETGDGYPELDKLIQISNLFDVTLDYLVKTQEDINDTVPEVIEVEPVVTAEDIFEDEKIRPTPRDEMEFTDIIEVEDYIELRQRFASKIGIGVMIIIASVVLPITLQFMENLAAALMMVFIGIGVGLIILAGINFSQIPKPDFVMNASDHSYFMAEFSEIKARFAKKIAFGVFTILAGVAFTIIGEELLSNENLGAGIMMILIGFSVYLFITAGMELDTYRLVTRSESIQSDSYSDQPVSHKHHKRYPIAESSVIVFFILGFGFGLWHPGWMVFPIFGILDGVINKG